jgi:uncharacterized protein (DUF362 family)
MNERTMGKIKVYLDSIREYDPDKIVKILEEGIVYLGIEIPLNSKILIKPNVLGMYEPDMHIDTHPAVVEAAIRILLKRNNSIVLGDSSGNGQYGNTGKSLEKSGMNGLATKYGITVIAFDKHTNRVFKNIANHVFKEINLTTFIDEVDWIVNIPKLKSHTFTGFSGAIKNFYGMIPGAGKPNGHRIAPTLVDFSNGLLDIYGFVRPKLLLNIMDGIIGIEGAGPGPAGSIKKAGFIGMSTDAVALDAACLSVLNTDPQSIQTVRLAHNRGLSAFEPEVNKSVPRVDFKIPKSSRIEAFLNTIFPRLALSRPFVITDKCRKCALCEKACPGDAISMNDVPQFDYSRCIYCFCCHENCPEAAIDLKENWLFSVFKSFGKKE